MKQKRKQGRPKVVRESLGRIYYLEGPLEELEARIRTQFVKVLPEYTKLTVEEDYSADSVEYSLWGTRPMTEKEIQREEARKAKEKADILKIRANARERELETLRQLKAKYPEEVGA